MMMTRGGDLHEVWVGFTWDHTLASIRSRSTGKARVGSDPGRICRPPAQVCRSTCLQCQAGLLLTTMSHQKMQRPTTDYLPTNCVNIVIRMCKVSCSCTDLQTNIPKVLHGLTWSLQKMARYYLKLLQWNQIPRIVSNVFLINPANRSYIF
jgi:hypothetical protein